MPKTTTEKSHVCSIVQVQSEWETRRKVPHKATEHGLHTPLLFAQDGHLNGRQQNLPSLKWCVCMDLRWLPIGITLGQRDSDSNIAQASLKKENIEWRRHSIDLARDLLQLYNNTKDMQMKNWYNVYAYTRMPFGVHKGKYLREVPDGYLKWGIIHCADRATADMFSIELQRRYPKLRRENTGISKSA